MTDSATKGFNEYVNSGNKSIAESNGSFESTRRVKIDKNKGVIMTIKHSNGTLTPIESAVGDVIARIEKINLTPTPMRYGNRIVNQENFKMRGMALDLLHVQDSNQPNNFSTSLKLSTDNMNQKIRIGKKLATH